MVSNSRRTVDGTRQNGEKKNTAQKPSSMKVVVRVRPFNSVESSCKAGAAAIRVMDQNVLVFDPNEECEAINFPGASRKRTRNICERRARDLRFIFDRVFDCKAKNTDLFEHTTKEIIDGVLDGYNCTVFAYGATGAGKTFTMLGSNTCPGVMFLTMMDLYRRIHDMKDEKTIDVAVSYLEVYNETIRDLLLPGPALAVREDPQRGVCVSGLTLHKPRTAEELLSMLEFGNNNRTQHPTDANAQSSRSHAVFQVFVRQKDRTAGLQANVRLAKMSLIDLAGSERATVTTNRGARFREGANINKSLLALGNCINALADKENKSGHIPYRDSKLTRLLKDSLGGNCRTVMIAAISPSSMSYEDTYNTLKYADRAKSIKVNLTRNVVSVDFHVSRYAKIVDELRTEITELKTKLSHYEAGDDVPSRHKTPISSASKSQGDREVQRLKVLLRSIMNEREIIKKDMVDIEAAQRDLLVKTFRKERDLERIRQLCVEGDTTREKAALKTHKCLSATKTKKKKIETRIRESETKLQQNTKNLDRVQEEINALSEEVDDRLVSCQSALKAELECAEWRRQCRYYKKYAQAQEKDSNNTERLVLKMLAVVKKQFLLLKGAGLATPDVSRDYDSIVGLTSEGREVSWADQSAMETTDKSSMSNFISFDSVVDGTPVRPLVINEPTSSVTTTTPYLAKLLKTPIYFEKRSKESPIAGNPRLSLCKEFDAVTSPARQRLEVPNSSSRGISADSSASGPSHGSRDKTPCKGPSLDGTFTNKQGNATPLLDANGNAAPLELISKRNPTPKIAWSDLPSRARDASCLGDKSPGFRGSGELNISGVMPALSTPKQGMHSGMSSKAVPPSRPFTPLRELSLNSRKVMDELHSAGLPSMYDTPSKKAKLSEKPYQKGAAVMKNRISSASMMPKRDDAAKENAPPANKPFRKAVSASVMNQQRIQRHLTGVKRAISNTGGTRSFAPRSSRTEPSQGKPRWQ